MNILTHLSCLELAYGTHHIWLKECDRFIFLQEIKHTHSAKGKHIKNLETEFTAKWQLKKICCLETGENSALSQLKGNTNHALQ